MSAGGMLNGLVRGLTAGTVGYGEGEREAQQRNISLASLMLQREQQQALTNARVRYYGSRADALDHPQPKLEDKLHDRVQALVQQGVPLAKAAEQARREFGQQVAPDPVAVHAAERRIDVNNPVPRAGAGAGGSKLSAAARAAQALASGDARNATAAQTALDTEFPVGAPVRTEKNAATFPGDSTAYVKGKQRVDQLRARADSSSAQAHQLTNQLAADATGDDEGDDTSSSASSAAPARSARTSSSSANGAGSSFTPKLLPQHRLIDQNAAAAIKAGKDPEAVEKRAQQLHAQLEQTQASPLPTP